MTARKLHSGNWLGKASAGVILGFALALGLSGVFARFGPGEIGFFSGQAQFTMWIMGPLWAGVLSFCFLFHSGARAWLWLGAANAVAWGLAWAPYAVTG